MPSKVKAADVTARIQVRVLYADTDRMGIVYHANYLRWAEAGRGEWMRARGRTYKEVEAAGIYLPLVESHLRYHAPAFYDDLLTVETFIVFAQRASIKMGYRFWVDGKTEKPIVTGHTIHALTDAKGRVLRVPKDWYDVFGVDPKYNADKMEVHDGQKSRA
ncbi:MAG: acyl-CoA thioesterase [Deltaproteobacteria bacterium]|nr:acyl-CoA thioesterase [Deltaproteobacteria bacterium]